MRTFIAAILGILIGVVVGISYERQLRSPTLICSDVPNCPRCPSCPNLIIDGTLTSCLKTIDLLVSKNNILSKDFSDCSLSFSLCQADAGFWQDRYLDCNGYQ